MEHNLSIERTVPHGVTTPLPGLEHPSFPGQTIPAVLDGHTPPDWCVHCAWLAGQIRAADARGDWSRVADHARTAIGHVGAAHPGYGIHNVSARGPAQPGHNLTGGAR